MDLILAGTITLAQFVWPSLMPGERAILMELYKTAGGSRSKALHAWGTEVSPCEWDGVICDQTLDGTATVRLIDLSDKGLAGSLPESLTRLRGLRGLDVSGNNLRGEFPPALLDRWDGGSLELDLAGNAFANLPVEARVEVRNPHLLCGQEVNWISVAAGNGRINYQSTECTPPETRRTHCVVREGYGGSLARLGRALDRLGYRTFRREYSDEQFLTTHTTFLTTAIRYGDGREVRVTTSGTQEPLAVWTAQRLVLSHVRSASWETQTTSAACSMVR